MTELGATEAPTVLGHSNVDLLTSNLSVDKQLKALKKAFRELQAVRSGSSRGSLCTHLTWCSCLRVCVPVDRIKRQNARLCVTN